MNKTIKEASTYLTGLLPPDAHFYTADDLLKLGMPDFIVRRIKMEIADRLNKALDMPTSEWLDGESAVVATSWNQFIEAVKGEVHMPRKHAADIIDNAVIETVELIVAPRRRVIEWLFGPSNEASLSVVRQRSQYITVNRYLVDSLVRYMERKDLHTISKVLAVEVIKMVDDRYVTGYTPLSWAHLTDPLFQLARNRVEADLLHDFFVDKGREDLAALFPESDTRIERVQLIERLSLGARGERRERAHVREHIHIPVQEEAKVHVQELVPVPVLERAVLVEGEMKVLETKSEDQPSASVIPIWQQFLSDIPEDMSDDERDEVSDDEQRDKPNGEPEMELDIEINNGKESAEVVPFAQLFVEQQRQVPTIASMLSSVGFRKSKLVDSLKTNEIAYIERVFDGNEKAYFRTIAELESCRDWSEAQSTLKAWIRSVNIDLENVELAHMVDQIQIFFTTNDS